MNWIRVLIILLFVAGGLWIFTPGAHQPVEVTQMEIGFLNGEEFEWLSVITDDTGEPKKQINEVLEIVESATLSSGISCFSELPDIQIIIFDVNKSQYLVDGCVYLTETGGIYEDREGNEQKQLSMSDIAYLQGLR